MTQQILQYLYDLNNGEFIDISGKLIELVGHADHAAVKPVLKNMYQREDLIILENGIYQQIGTGYLNDFVHSLNDSPVKAKITVLGIEKLAELNRIKRQDDLNQSLIETNSSLKETNTSIRQLNTRTLDYYTQLQWATWVIAGATILNAIFTILVFAKPDKDFSKDIYNYINLLDKAQGQTAKSIEGIESSVKKIATDSFYQKRTYKTRK